MDIYEEVTCRIVEQMEQGEIPWRKPWIAGGSCVSYATSKPYSLLNQMLLGQPGEYLTFRQCRQAGWAHPQGREGAHGCVLEVDRAEKENRRKEGDSVSALLQVFHINKLPKEVESDIFTKSFDEQETALHL